LDLNYNPDGPQWLEAIQGIELLLSNLFFLIPFVILVSNNSHFCALYYLRTALQRTGGRDPVDSHPLDRRRARALL
jgi:hypothetical protein